MMLRDLRAGELHLLGLALIVAVASLTSVGFLTDRVGRSLEREANQLLGGDLLLQADHPWSAEVRELAAAAGLRQVDTLVFSSMVSADAGFQLAAVKAVGEGYPLRGELRVAPARNAPDAVAQGIPAPGEIWLDERVMASLDARVGEHVQLGNSQLRVAGMLTFESDRGANFFSLLPRVMVNTADLPATGLIQTGSRVRYRLHLAGEEAAVGEFRQRVEPRLGRGERIESVDDARPGVRRSLDRAERFLRLAASLAVVLAAVAIGLGARRFMQRHLDGCAVMRCLGAGQGQLVWLHGIEFLCFGVGASLLGVALGWAVQATLADGMAGLVGSALPPPGPLPVLHGVVVGLVLLLGFVLPHLIGLARVPTLRVLRRELQAGRRFAHGAWASGLATLVAIVVWVAGEPGLGLWVSLGFVGALLGFAALSALVLRAVARAARRSGGGWRRAAQAVERHLGSQVLQATALGLGLMALLVLTLVRADLLAAWRDSVPPDAPNRFVINLQPDQREAFEAQFAEAGLPPPQLLPMIRGRLVEINGEPVAADDYEEPRARRLAEREFNLSYSAQAPEGNTIGEGRWHGAADAPEFSVEEGIAETLGVKLGDEVVFDIAGQRVRAPVTSVRTLRWDSMRVNFFFIASPGLLEDYPASLITSFHLPDARRDFALELARAFPNISLIDVGAVLAQLESMVERLITVVELVFGFAVAAGVIVLLAALQSTQDARAQEFAVMRTLGARRAQLRQTLLLEFALLGTLAGALAGVGASVTGWLLARQVFDMPYLPALAPVAVGAAAGATGVLLFGWLGARGLLRRSPLALLREAV